MDFKERFIGRTTIMNKEGVIGIVASKGIPIDKTGAFEHHKQLNEKGPRDNINCNFLFMKFNNFTEKPIFPKNCHNPTQST